MLVQNNFIWVLFKYYLVCKIQRFSYGQNVETQLLGNCFVSKIIHNLVIAKPLKCLKNKIKKKKSTRHAIQWLKPILTCKIITLTSVPVKSKLSWKWFFIKMHNEIVFKF